MRWRAPNTLGFALACFRRAIRSHRRLVRLAPSFFDSAVIECERREQEARRRWMDSCRLALNKVYGTSADPLPSVPELPRLPSTRTRIAVERELASCRLWLGLGSHAFRLFKLYHPHSLVNFCRLVRLLKIASDLGRLATGADSPQSQIKPDIYAIALADLKRAYGYPRPPVPSNTTPSEALQREVGPRSM